MSGRRWILFTPGNTLAKVHPSAICSHDSPRVGPCVIINNMRASVVLFTIVALMVVAVMPLGTALAQPNPVRALPEKVYRGETFNVTVTFTSPTDQFNNLFLADSAPDGWNVTVVKAWSTPNADNVNATGNQVSFSWTGPYSGGTNFAALYKVTVPNDAEPGNYTFSGLLRYYLDSSGPQSAPVAGASQVEVVLRPAISFSPTNLSFSAVKGGSNPANQTLEIWNSGGETLNWTLSDDAAWLSESPANGSSTGEHGNVTVVVNITGMFVGNYSANITINATGASNSPQVVPVSLHISQPPAISLSTPNLPPSFSFSATQGGTNPDNQTLEIWNSGGGILNWTLSDDADWLSEIPENGTSSGEYNNVTVVVNITGMFVGNYSANITINATGASNSPRFVPVSLHISQPPAISFLSNLNFSAVEGGLNPGSKTLEIWNSGGETLNWSLIDDAAWLSAIPENGTSSGEHNNVTVSVNITGMSDGDHIANITINATGASNSPRFVPVSLHISPTGGGTIGGGGGGGGGGGSCYLDIDILGKITRVKISCVTGITLKDVVVSDVNNTNFLEIDSGTRVICDDTSKAPTALVMSVANESPTAPDGSVIIGPVYNFTGNYTLNSCGKRNTPHCCSGVTFDQNITIVLNYDPNELPESTASVAIAYYDNEQGSWVSLPTDIGRVAEIGKATGLINHCSAVAIIAKLAPPPAPASFMVSGLNIEQSPRLRENIFVAVIGENVTITGSIANNGGQEGTYTAVLKLNGTTVATREVTLAAGQSQQVSFTLSGMDYGQYKVEVGGLSVEFTVSRSIDWWSIIGIIAAVGLITWGAIWGIRRRKPTQSTQPAQPTQSE